MTLSKSLSTENFTVLLPDNEEEFFFSFGSFNQSLDIHLNQKYRSYNCKLKCCGQNTKLIMISLCVAKVAIILFGLLGYTIGSGLCSIGKESFKECFLKPRAINLSFGLIGSVLVASVGLCFMRCFGFMDEKL